MCFTNQYGTVPHVTDIESDKHLRRLLNRAEDQLWVDFENAGEFSHNGLAGSGREGAVAKFLRAHLPTRFVVTTGQAVDSEEAISTQLDVIVYDSHLSAPLVRSDDAEILPAEALLAVVEVKTTFTLAEAKKCAKAVQTLAGLKPYGKQFTTARTQGQSADDGLPRCMYSVLAFDSNLAADEWVTKEWERIRGAAEAASVDVARIDRVAILKRGLIVPPTCSARTAADDKGVLRDWFLHLSDFLVREATHRRPYDWNRYGRAARDDSWVRLDGYESTNAAARERRATQKAREPTKSRRSRYGRRRPKNTD